MSLDNPGHETEFTQDQQQLARAIGQQAAVAIDNARLYQEAQAERQRGADLKARLLAEARHAIASSNERANTLNAIFNAMTEGILVLDQEGHIIASNNAAEKMLLWSEHVEQHTEEDQLLARSMQHSIHTYLRNYRITTLSGMPIPYEDFPLVRGLRGELIQGERFWSKKGGGTGNDIAMEMNTVPLLDSDNKKIGIVSSFRDITEQVRNEQRLRRALTTMRESNAQKEEILAITAHEFRTPLTVILAHSQMILRVLNRTQDTNPQLKGRLLESNSCIEDQIRQLTNIVDTFLEVTRLNRGKLSLEHEPLDVVELISETIANHRATSTIHQISYQAYPLGQPYFIYGDRARLLQIFDNLLQNAIKYSPQGGPITFTITLQDRRSPHATEATGETTLPPFMVDITLADQGIGVPPDAQSHLFECFYRAPNIVSTQARGVGLGLYVVSEFVHLHGGSIRVESSGIEGEGSRFMVSLPLLPHDV